MNEYQGVNKKEMVVLIPISEIDDFPNHPFQVKDDEKMEQLVHSIRMNGVLNPLIVRKKTDGRFEIVAGHRRKRACAILGLQMIPAIEREMNRDDAIIEMVDSNIQRETILPSEKARAYKMKLEAMKRQGFRTDLTFCPPGTKLNTAKDIAEQSNESERQIYRYVRLTELVPELLDYVDAGKLALRPAVELSYLQEEEQRALVETIESEDCFPSHAQTIRMKQLSRDGKLDMDAIFDIMTEQKGNQKEKIKIPMEKLEKYFPRGTPPKRVEDTIIKALEFYRKRQRESREAR